MNSKGNRMENVKYDLKKVAIITTLFVSFFLCISIVTTSVGILHEILIHIILLFFALLLILVIHHSENKGVRHGLFFSKNEILIVINRKKYQKPWSLVKVRCSFKIFHYFYFIFFSFEGLKNFPFLLSPASKESFLELVEKYVPCDHELTRIANEYAKKNN